MTFLPPSGITTLLPAAAAAFCVTLAHPVCPASAQDLPGPVVSVEWLGSNLEAPGLVILHAGGSREAFQEGHVPGARFFDVGSVAYSRGEMDEPDHVMLDLPDDLSVVRSALEAAGISDDSRVIITYDSPRRATTATRLLWTLEFMGLGDRSALLDGGTEAWRAAGGELAAGEGEHRPGTLTSAPLQGRRVDRDWVQAKLDTPGVALVDARRPDAYSGEREEFPGRGGHIPGAGNLPIEELFREDGRLRPASELQELLARAGVEPGDTVVAYCHIGLRATAVILAARVAGYRAVLYDGSMNEWARDAARPLAVGNR